MRFPWEPNFIELMRDKETRLHTRSGLEPQAIGVATASTVSAAGERPSSLFHCENCDQTFLTYPRLLNHYCHDEEW